MSKENKTDDDDQQQNNNKTNCGYCVCYKQRPYRRQIDQLTNKLETVNIAAKKKIQK